MPIPGISIHTPSIGMASMYSTVFPEKAVIPIKVTGGKVERAPFAYGDGLGGKFADTRVPIGLDVSLCRDFVFYRGDAGSDPFPQSRRDRFAPTYRPPTQSVPQVREKPGTTVYILAARPLDVPVMSDAPMLPPTLHRITNEVLHLPTPSDDQFGPAWLSDLNPGGFDRDPFRAPEDAQ